MYINNQNIGSYQGLSTNSTISAKSPKVAVTSTEPLNPATAGTKAGVTNPTTRTLVNDSNAQRNPDKNSATQDSPRQPLPQDFDFATAASSGVNNQTVYDQPSGANRFAISSYQQVVNAPKREEIQRLVGIDTFA